MFKQSILTIWGLVIALCLSLNAFAQVPQAFNYQAVARDIDGDPIQSQPVNIRLSILQGSPAGTIVYQESHATSTNALGLFSLRIGQGNVLEGDFAQINWINDDYFLQVEVEDNGNFQNLGTSQFLSVPYAITAQRIGDPSGSGPGVVPVGTVVAYMGTTPPEGWLLCDGSIKSRTEFSALFSVIGTSCGSPDSSGFNLPDLRGRFLRGVDGAASQDPDKDSRTAMNLGGNTGNVVGSVQEDDFESHEHNISGWGLVRRSTGGNDTVEQVDRTPGEPDTRNSPRSMPKRGGNETRPKNAYVNYIIKF